MKKMLALMTAACCSLLLTSTLMADPVNISVINRINATVVLEDNPVVKELVKVAGVNLDIEAPPINNYNDKLQIVMASGEAPDLIYNWFAADANYQTWAKNGLLTPLDDKLAKYPNLMANINKDLWNSVRADFDGKIYLIPRMNTVNHWGYMINQQWLDKLKLKAPTTLDEFTAVCRAFTKNDPDGNGKDDTFGITFANPSQGNNTIWNASSFLTSAFGIGPIGSSDTDGQYKIREKMNGYLPYLTYIKQLVAEKIIDPEFFMNKVYVDTQKLEQGRVGITYSHQSGVLSLVKDIPEPETKFTYHASLKNSKGVASDWITPAMWGGWMISAKAKNVDAILKYLDWGNTPEAVQLFQLGIKGLTYNSYDPVKKLVDRTPEQSAKLQTITSTYMTVANAVGGLGAYVENSDTPARAERYSTDFNAAMKLMTPISVPPVRAPKLNNLKASIPDLVTKKDSLEMKYIMGSITQDEYKAFLAKEYFPATAEAEKEYVDYMKKIAP